MRKTNNIGLVGCGIWGKKILKTLLEKNVDVTVFEASQAYQEEALNLGAKKFIVYKQSLAKEIKQQFDGIVVATPSSTHRTVIEELSDFSIPLFVEKPLTTNLADAQSLVEISHNEIFMMHIWQYHPGINMLASIAKEKKLGELLQIKTSRTNWTSPRIDTDTLWNLMAHDLSIFQTILGEIPKPVFAIAEKHNDVKRDLTVIFGKQPYCVTQLSNRSESKMREVRLQCSKGVARLKNEQDNYIEIIHGDDKSAEPSIERITLDNTTALETELTVFLDYLNGGPPPISNLYDGLRIIETIDEIDKLTS